MEKIKLFFADKFRIELTLAVVLFAIALYLDMIVKFIVFALYFMIFLEIVRALMGFIREKRVKIGILIDVFIILALREFIVNVVKINNEKFDNFYDVFSSSTNYHVMIFSGVLIFLFALRYLAHITSPDKEHRNSKKLVH